MRRPSAPGVFCEFLGPPRVRVDGARRDLALQRGYALLAYLLHSGRDASRSHLAGLLWPGVDESVARSRLRRLAYSVEKKLGQAVFTATGHSLALKEGAVTADSIEFARLARAFVSGEPDELPALDRLLDLAARAGHGFLEGLAVDSPAFDDWLRLERLANANLLSRLLASLSQHLLAAGRVDTAHELVERWVALDPCAEPAYVRLMQLHAAAGNVAGIEAGFMRCAQALRDEFGIKPGPETESAYLALLEKTRSGLAPPAPADSPVIRFAPAPGGMVAYASLGEGPALVICPGFVSHIEIAWESPQVRHALQVLARNHRVLVFDRRGIGLSERVAPETTLDSAANDVIAMLDHAGVGAAWVFGASEGGPIALKLAATRPDRVHGLVLFGAMAKGSSSADYPHALPPVAFDSWLEQLVDAWGGPAGIEVFSPEGAGEPATRAWWARMLRHATSPAGLRVVLGCLRDVDVRPLLAGIRVPTLVMHRQGDRAVRADAGQHLATHIPGAHWLPLPGDDHWWWKGDSDAVLSAIALFTSGKRP